MATPFERLRPPISGKVEAFGDVDVSHHRIQMDVVINTGEGTQTAHILGRKVAEVRTLNPGEPVSLAGKRVSPGEIVVH